MIKTTPMRKRALPGAAESPNADRARTVCGGCTVLILLLLAVDPSVADNSESDKELGESSYNVRNCEPLNDDNKQQAATEPPVAKDLDECRKQTP